MLPTTTTSGGGDRRDQGRRGGDVVSVGLVVGHTGHGGLGFGERRVHEVRGPASIWPLGRIEDRLEHGENRVGGAPSRPGGSWPSTPPRRRPRATERPSTVAMAMASSLRGRRWPLSVTAATTPRSRSSRSEAGPPRGRRRRGLAATPGLRTPRRRARPRRRATGTRRQGTRSVSVSVPSSSVCPRSCQGPRPVRIGLVDQLVPLLLARGQLGQRPDRCARARPAGRPR